MNVKGQKIKTNRLSFLRWVDFGLNFMCSSFLKQQFIISAQATVWQGINLNLYNNIIKKYEDSNPT